MRKIYSTLLVALMTMFAFTAKAADSFPLTLVVNDVDAWDSVGYFDADFEYTELDPLQGVQTINLPVYEEDEDVLYGLLWASASEEYDQIEVKFAYTYDGPETNWEDEVQYMANDGETNYIYDVDYVEAIMITPIKSEPKEETTMKYTFMIDDPSQITIGLSKYNTDTYEYERTPLELKAGTNVVDLPITVSQWNPNVKYADLYFECTEGYAIDEVFQYTEDDEWEHCWDFNKGQTSGNFSIYVGDNKGLKFQTISMEDLLPDTFTIKLDEELPAGTYLNMYLNGFYLQWSNENLKVGDNVCHFNEELFLNMQINKPGAPFYRVLVDDQPISASSSYSGLYWAIDKLEAGSVIDLQVAYPDVVSTVSFSASLIDEEGEEEGTRGAAVDNFIQNVWYDEVTTNEDGETVTNRIAVEDWSSFEVQLGTQVLVKVDENLYKIENFMLNDNTIPVPKVNYGADRDLISIYILNEKPRYEFEVSAYPIYTWEIDIPDASLVDVRLGSTSNDPIEITDGVNEIELVANGYYGNTQNIYVTPKVHTMIEECYYTLVEEGEEVNIDCLSTSNEDLWNPWYLNNEENGPYAEIVTSKTDYSSGYPYKSIIYQPGEPVALKASKMEGDYKNLYFYATGVEESYAFNFRTTNGQYYEVENGRNEIEYLESDLPFTVTCYSTNYGTDGTITIWGSTDPENTTTYSTYYDLYGDDFDFDIEENMVIKLVVAEEAMKVCTVNVENPMGFPVKVVTDGVIDQTEPEFYVLEGAALEVQFPEGAAVGVTANGQTLYPWENGNYLITVEEDLVVALDYPKDSFAWVYVDNTAVAQFSENGTAATLEEGWNRIEWNSNSKEVLGFKHFSANGSYLFVNYELSKNNEVEVENGDIIYWYLAEKEQPSVFEVSIQDYTAEAISVLVDSFIEPADTKEFKAMEGSSLELAMNAEANIPVFVNGVRVYSSTGEGEKDNYLFTVEENMEIVLGMPAADQIAYVFVDNAEEASVVDALGTELALESGRNEVEFNDLQNPFLFSSKVNQPAYLFVNNVAMEDFNINLNNNDVVKFFVNAEAAPALYTMSFNNESSARMEVVTDGLQNQSESEFEVVEGTAVELKLYGLPEGGVVRVAFTEEQPDGSKAEVVKELYNLTENPEYKVYNFVAVSDAQFTITNTAAISSIAADGAKAGVYTVTGILLDKEANAADIEALPAGMYIINGQKVIKK